MDFGTLKDRTREYCDFAGYADTIPPLDPAYLVNEALRQISTEAEYNKEDTTITTVAGTSSYLLTSPPDWIRITDVLYGTTKTLYPTDEPSEKERNSLWTQQASGSPERWWVVAPNTIRLIPTPNTSSDTVYIRGTREAAALSADSDTPGFPVRYHDAIPLLAAWLHLKKVAVGNEYVRGQNYFKECMQRVGELKEEIANQNLSFRRTVSRTPQERIWLGGWYVRR